MKTKSWLLAVVTGIILLAGIQSCKKDMAEPIVEPIPSGPFTVTLPNNPVVLSVAGKVTDENNNPVVGATVTGGGKSVTTNAQGFFKISQGNFNGNYGTIRIEKVNYFTLVKTIQSKSGATQYIIGKLSPKTLIGKVGTAGGTINFAGGMASVSFPENAFLNSAGNAITDSVNIYATYLDPTAADINQRMPGNLAGVEAPSTAYQLQSYGMLAVELKDAGNQTVKLAPGKKATINANIPASLTASAPASIPLWYFDESAGVWVKEGSATKNGNSYSGEVSHFTFWNMDIYNTFCWFEARYKNRSDSSILSYAHLSFNGVGSNVLYHAYTDANGYTYGMIPVNVPLQMRFYNTNGTVLLDTTIGPFAGSTNIGNVYINFPPTTPAINGTLVNCNGIPVTSGSITVMIDSLDYHADVAQDGSFHIPVMATMALNTVITVTGIDSTTSASVPTLTFTYTGNNTINAGYVFACATGGPSEFISYNFDGTDHMFIRNLDSAFCRRTFAFNRTEIACRRANGSPMIEGYVAFITGPTTTGGTDTSSILTLHQYSTASTPKSLNIISFTESYTAYPPAQGVEGWVIGQFNCSFRDSGTTIHNISSNFKMWRRN